MTTIKTDLAAFKADLRALMDRYTIIAPVIIDGKLDYQQITDPDQIDLGDALPYKSPKEVVFPRVEALMRFTADQVTEAEALKPVLLIGAKPCDLAALRVLDAVFTGDKGRFVDTFYKKRRDALLIFGLACAEKKRGCFCDERGIDRSFSTDSDAFITVDGDRLEIDIVGTLPDELLGALHGERSEAPDVDSNTPEIQPLLEVRADETELFDAMPWEQYVEGCLGCGTCTYICPTCHCFEFKDVEKDGSVTRYRCWDSCMYPKFTLHASGHNPRATKKERFRQRVLHKYVYIPKNFGYTACTGCGRCVRACPGGVSIRKAVKDINARLSAARSSVDEANPAEKGATK